MKSSEVLTGIERQKAIPVVRASTDEQALRICRRLLDAGLATIELTTTVPNWKEVFTVLRETSPESTIGIGTILSAADATAACELGAQFLVTPFPVPEARRVADEKGVLFLGGGFTPAEIAAAAAVGPCKLFPAHIGGTSYLKSLKSIMPGARIMPTGGIAVGEVRAWLAAGAFAVGIGSDLYAAADFGDALATLRLELAASMSAE